MLTVEGILLAVRQVALPPNRSPTERQIEGVAQLGLGFPPADMTFAEASAILTARSAAREVLHELGNPARMHRAIRLQLEPYIVYFIVSDQHVLSELIERNEQRWGFCKRGHPPPTEETRTKVFDEVRRLIAGAPYSTHGVLSTPGRRGQRNRRSLAKRRIASSGVQSAGPVYWVMALIRTLMFWPSARPLVVKRVRDAQPVRQVPPNDERPVGTVLMGRASVIDGDTLEIHGRRIRIWGIDAPEDGQLGVRDGRPWRCGQDCAQALTDFLASHTVACVPMGHDEFKRIIARCEVAGFDVGDWMVRKGWALDYKQFSNGYYAEAQAEAKDARRGLWQGEFELPWKWRVRARWLFENRSPPSNADLERYEVMRR